MDFSGLELVNSNAIDLKISMSYARPKSLTLKFDDGEETVCREAIYDPSKGELSKTQQQVRHHYNG